MPNSPSTRSLSPTGQHKQQKKHKPYEEIISIFNGNEVKIRVPKSTTKAPKLTPSQLKLQQLCTCADDESVCSETCGFGTGAEAENQLQFQRTDAFPSAHGGVHTSSALFPRDFTITAGDSNGDQYRRLAPANIPDDICEATSNRTPMNSELVYSKQEHHQSLCNSCNVTPKDAPKGVKAHKVHHANKDVFILKIGKQTDEPNRTGNIEVQLVTPRAPAKPMPVARVCKIIQCEEPDIACCAPCRTCRATPMRRKKRPPCYM